MVSQWSAIKRIEHSFAFLNLFHRKLFNTVGQLRRIRSPTTCSAAENSQDITLTTRHYRCILFPSIASCRRFFPLPAAVQNGNYIHAFIVLSQAVQPWLEVVVPPRVFALVEDNLGLRSGTIYNPMSSGIYIDQQFFLTPNLICFHAFLEYRFICLNHFIDRGFL